MAVTLGKRKRCDKALASEDQDSSSSGDENVRALFQKAFEAKFRPLKVRKPSKTNNPPVEEVDNAEEQEESEWSGLSGSERDVEIIEHDAPQNTDRDQLRRETKAFMSTKPPSSEQTSVSTAKQKTSARDPDEGETANLKNDLALQRLLKEAHLLGPTSSSNESTAPEGKQRIKALDLHLQGLGAKKSLLAQEKMPLAHRKGILAKSASKEDKRRKEAAENGIVLERAKAVTGRGAVQKRLRSVGGPTVGRFKGGTLRLSERDVRGIEGPKRGGSGGRGRGKGRGRGR